MSNELPTLTAEKRDRLGTRYARRIRAAGKLPAVMYGHGKDPLAITVEGKDTLSHLEAGQRVFKVDVEGAEETCIVKDLQFGYLGTDVIHIDLGRIDLKEEVTTNVALHFTGTPVGLKEEGAILRTVADAISVRCKAGDIPSEGITVDISELEANAMMTAGEISLPPGLVLAADPESAICRVAIVAEEVTEEVPEELVEGEPEIIGEKTEEPEAEAEEDTSE